MRRGRVHGSNSDRHGFTSRGKGCPRSASGRPSRDCRGRRECRVKTSPMARLRTRMQAAGTTGKADHPAFPARRSSRLYAVSWCAGLVGHHSGNALARTARDTSIGVSGRCDFTSTSNRSSAHRKTRCDRSRPPLPASRVVTIAMRPSAVRRDADRQTRFPKKRNRII